MAIKEATEDPSFLTPLGYGHVRKVVYADYSGGRFFGAPHYHEADSFARVPNGATVYSVTVEVPQICTDGEPAASVMWTETCP